MARFRASEADNYGGNGGGGFFSLSNDGDTAQVRFMYNGIDDVEGYAVHQIEVDGKKRYVNCLREYNEPVDKCPLCANNSVVLAKLFVPVYDIDADTTKVWERGKKFFAKMSSLCAHYPDVIHHTFEIERHGKKGDTSTTYEIYETGKDDTTLDDLPEMPKILGGLVLDKSADELNYYLDEGVFPSSDNDDKPSRREGRRDNSEIRRRTPSNNRRRVSVDDDNKEF